MAIGLLIRHWDEDPWIRGLNDALGTTEVYVYPELPSDNQLEFLACWRPDPGELSLYPHLRYIQCLGAGVDQLIGRDDLPEGAVISRIVDPLLTSDMSEHIMAILLQDMKHLPTYADNQLRNQWIPQTYRRWKELTIGILGMGELGSFAADSLVGMGAQVQGWSRSAKNIAGVKSRTGAAGLDQLLRTSDYVINLLPLTPSTRGILSKRLFSQMLPSAALINVGRGAHMIEQDLLTALDEKQLRVAHLDVFGQEPLPVDHPFWNHPSISITPHIASRSNPETVIAQVVDNYRRAQRSEDLLHTIDMKAGY